MNCIVDKAIRLYKSKPRKIRVLRRYLKMKYNIQIDQVVLKKRVNQALNCSDWEIA